jgi:(p)ppGpp synthase/HD superfamily hydrolase
MNSNMYSKKDYFEIQKAILFLNKSFANVENGSKPELLHSLHTGFRLLDYRYPAEIIIAGLLHDVIEEGSKHEDIKNLFGKNVYELVLVNSKNESIEDWFIQTTKLVSKIASHSENALIVKTTDILDNFIYRFHTGTELEKEKVIHLAKQIFKYTNSTNRVFGELRRMYKNRNKK